MSFKQFDNPNSIPWRVIRARLLNADPQAIIDIHKIEIRDPITFLVTGTRDQINVDTVLTDTQILNGLSTPATQIELDAIIREDGARARAKAIAGYSAYTEAEALAFLKAFIGDSLAVAVPTLSSDTPTALNQLRNMVIGIKSIMTNQYIVEQNIVRMFLAMRDEKWSNLKDV